MYSISQELDRITAHVGRYGIDASDPQLRRLASLAGVHQVQPSIVSLLTDTSAPDVVRGRAFARVVMGLRNRPTPAFTAAA